MNRIRFYFKIFLKVITFPIKHDRISMTSCHTLCVHAFTAFCWAFEVNMLVRSVSKNFLEMHCNEVNAYVNSMSKSAINSVNLLSQKYILIPPLRTWPHYWVQIHKTFIYLKVWQDWAYAWILDLWEII